MALRKLSSEEIANLGINPNQRSASPAGDTGKRSSDIIDKLSSGLNTVFGGGVIGEAIGTQIARARATEEEKKFIPKGPSTKEVGADVARSALTFFPVGRAASTATKIASPFLGKGIGKLAGNVATGGGLGLAFDISESVRNQEQFSPIGSVLGAGLPIGGAALKGAVRGGGVLARELSGVGTGTSSEALQEMFRASKAGDKQAKAAVDALRGKVDERVIVNDARISLEGVINRRNTQFQERFAEIINNEQTLDISPINRKVDEMISKFRIKKAQGGQLDFSQSPLKFNPQAQTEIKTIVEEMRGFGTQKGDRTPLGVDTLKRAFDDIYSESSQARAFTAAVRKETRNVLSGVKNYNQMERDYENSTRLIKELTKSLSLKDPVAVEAQFKKLTTALRTNNEFRAELVRQLDEEAGNFISAQIAGQQLSEILPRGLLRTFGLGASAVGFVSGGTGLMPLLITGSLTSPRLTGEIINILGMSSRQADDFVRGLRKIVQGEKTGSVSPGDVLFNR